VFDIRLIRRFLKDMENGHKWSGKVLENAHKKVLESHGKPVFQCSVRTHMCLYVKSDHVLFCGDGALAFAKQHGVEEVPAEYLATEKSRKRLANFSKFQPSLKVEFYQHASRLVAWHSGRTSVLDRRTFPVLCST